MTGSAEPTSGSWGTWSSEPCLLGIDEAGRGPVLGPMVYASAFCAISRKEELKGCAFADSKTLTEEKRESLFDGIKGTEWMGYHIESLSAQEISRRMLSQGRESLNKLANEATFDLIRSALKDGVNLTEVYVDTVGDADRHQQRLKEMFPSIDFTVCPKADALYPIVSAASIVAKVTRDRAMKHAHISEKGLELTEKMGSGYPADPDTKVWLSKNIDPVFGFPSILRFSWQTATRILDAEAVAVGWECDDEPTQSNRLPFHTSTNKGASSGAGRHSFFRSRKLQRVSHF